jgi:hypothetical protein
MVNLVLILAFLALEEPDDVRRREEVRGKILARYLSSHAEWKVYSISKGKRVMSKEGDVGYVHEVEGSRKVLDTSRTPWKQRVQYKSFLILMVDDRPVAWQEKGGPIHIYQVNPAVGQSRAVEQIAGWVP